MVGKSGQISLGKSYAGKTLRLQAPGGRQHSSDCGGTGAGESALDSRGTSSDLDFQGARLGRRDSARRNGPGRVGSGSRKEAEG